MAANLTHNQQYLLHELQLVCNRHGVTQLKELINMYLRLHSSNSTGNRAYHKMMVHYFETLYVYEFDKSIRNYSL